MRPKIPRKESSINNDRGFVLPLSVLLVVVLSVSGMSYLQMDYLERRMVMNEKANHDAFYLANAGIERGRATFKVSVAGLGASWTPVLNDLVAAYPTDANPDPALCPSAATRGCVIPPFQTSALNTAIGTDGAAITFPDPTLAVPFDNGEYSVRAFNNENSLIDDDGILTLRARGTVRGETKILEVNVTAATSMKLINCLGEPGDICPNKKNDSMTMTFMEGRDPASSPVLPAWNPSFYSSADNLPCSVPVVASGNKTLVSGTPNKADEIQIQSGRCYFIDGSVTVKNAGSGHDNIVVHSTGDLLVSGGASFTNTIFIGGTDVQLQGNITTYAPGTYPAVISGGSVTKGDASVTIYGNVYAAGDIGSDQHPLNPNHIHGSLIGNNVYLKAAATSITDDNNPVYYAFMPGFDYPDELKTTVIVGNTWSEIQ